MVSLVDMAKATLPDLLVHVDHPVFNPLPLHPARSINVYMILI